MGRSVAVSNSSEDTKTSDSSAARHQYACVRCRQRRIKCDKVLPHCNKCDKDGTDCIYSARRPRNSQKLGQKSVSSRALLPTQTEPSAGVGRDAFEAQEVEAPEDEDDVFVLQEMRNLPQFDSRDSTRGRLFMARGRSTYVNSDKATQLAHIEAVLTTNTNDELVSVNYSVNQQTPPTEPAVGPNLVQSTTSLLTTLSTNCNLRALHPTPKVMDQLWEQYVRQVDILVKVLYKPCAAKLVQHAARNFEGITDADETLLFAIWLAATNSMTNEDCLRVHGQQRSALIRKYKYALEQALAQVGWMTTQEVSVLQALSLLLVFAPGNSARSTWMLSGIALSIAQSMGMHSDSTLFSLSPVETETRRRIWWALCQLDNRVAEECGLESHVPLAMDTKLPFHINDSDLDADSMESIKPRTEYTEMTMSRIKMEGAETSLKIKRAKFGASSSVASETERLVKAQIERYENTFLKYLDTPLEVHRQCRLGTQLIILKLRRIMYETMMRSRGAQDGGDMKEWLLVHNTEILDITHRLPSKSWYFRCKGMRWHAMAFLLIELCKPVQGPAVDRAWELLEEVFANCESDGISANGGDRNHERKGILWQPMLKLLERARAVRRQVLATKGELPNQFSKESYFQDSDIKDSESAERAASGLVGDPFFGLELESAAGLDLQEWKSWLHVVENDLRNQPEDMMDYHWDNFTDTLNLW